MKTKTQFADLIGKLEPEGEQELPRKVIISFQGIEENDFKDFEYEGEDDD